MTRNTLHGNIAVSGQAVGYWDAWRQDTETFLCQVELRTPAYYRVEFPVDSAIGADVFEVIAAVLTQAHLEIDKVGLDTSQLTV